MSIDLEADTLIPVGKISTLLPKRVHTATIWRWIQRGVRGVKLETVLIGGRRYTSREALQQFIAATTAAADGDSSPAPSIPSRQRQRSHSQATDELERSGY